MRAISLLSQKGGCGKSTIAIHLAVAFSQAGRNTALLDLDPQASATEWGDARESEFPHVQSIQPSRLGKTIEQLKEIGCDIVILDTAPHSETTALDAARVSDLVLVPCQPSIMDLRALGKTVDLLKLVKVPAYAVINGVQHHSTVAAAEAAATIQQHMGLDVAPVMLGERVAFNRCLITGQSAQETDPNGKAALEIESLYRWTADLVTEKEPA